MEVVEPWALICGYISFGPSACFSGCQEVVRKPSNTLRFQLPVATVMAHDLSFIVLFS